MLGGEGRMKGCQVVVLVESYAVMSLEYPRLLDNYVKPAMRILSETSRDGSYGNNVSSKHTFTLVAVNPVAFRQQPVTSVLFHTMDLELFNKALTSVHFSGGGVEASCHWAEGLATAMEIFDELEKDDLMKETSVTRHCLLIAFSPPYQVAATQNDSYSGYTAMQLAKILGEKSIRLSLISARKHPALRNLHSEACKADLYGLPQRDVSVSSADLVLLQGFQLPDPKEAEASKVSTEEKSASTAAPSLDVKPEVIKGERITAITTVESESSRSYANPIQRQTTIQSNVSSTVTGANTNIVSLGRAQVSLNQVVPPSFSINSTFRPQLSTVSAVSTMPSVAQPDVPRSVASQALIQNSPFSIGNPAATHNPGLPNSVRLPIRTVPYQPATPAVSQNPNPPVTQNQPISQNPHNWSIIPQQVQQMQKQTIWSGALEWQDPNHQLGTRTTRTLLTSILVPPNVNIQTTGWPQKLSMLLMNSNLLQTVMPLLQVHRKIYFKPQISPDSTPFRALFHALTHKLIGLINVQAPMSEIRVIVLMWNRQKRALMGIVPENQVGVMTKIRVAILQARPVSRPPPSQEPTFTPMVSSASQVRLPQSQAVQSTLPATRVPSSLGGRPQQLIPAQRPVVPTQPALPPYVNTVRLPTQSQARNHRLGPPQPQPQQQLRHHPQQQLMQPHFQQHRQPTTVSLQQQPQGSHQFAASHPTAPHHRWQQPPTKAQLPQQTAASVLLQQVQQPQQLSVGAMYHTQMQPEIDIDSLLSNV